MKRRTCFTSKRKAAARVKKLRKSGWKVKTGRRLKITHPYFGGGTQKVLYCLTKTGKRKR